MRCLALEQVFVENNVRFEYLGNGEYYFFQENHYLDDEEEDEESKGECKVTYEEKLKNRYLKWNYRLFTIGDNINDYDELYQWLNQYNRKHGYCCYLGEDNCLYTTIHSILPENAEADLDACRAAWKMFFDMELMALLVVNGELCKPEPFTVHPLTEYEKAVMKKKQQEDFKVIPQPSPEETFGNMQKQLQDEINDLKISVAAGEISAEEADAKIKELEQLKQMLNP